MRFCECRGTDFEVAVARSDKTQAMQRGFGKCFQVAARSQTNKKEINTGCCWRKHVKHAGFWWDKCVPCRSPCAMQPGHGCRVLECGVSVYVCKEGGEKGRKVAWLFL